MSDAPAFKIWQGDCREVMETWKEGFFHTCITSPPYFGLRDYGLPATNWPAMEYAPMAGIPPVSVPAMSCCLGLEPDPIAFVGHLVLVFRAVRNVLREDGTLWLNLGDSYVSQGGDRTYGSSDSKVGRGDAVGGRPSCVGLKNKDLIGIPWRVALALQADGWWLRMDNIWHKENQMPESVTDRPTKAHEFLFLLAKSERYYYDSEAIREAAVAPLRRCGPNSRADNDRDPAHGTRKQNALEKRTYTGFNERWAERPVNGRNKRSVWTVAPQPFPEAHFATFPCDLVKPCVRAGSPVGGFVLDPFCGSGTTGVVAVSEGRTFVGVEMNPEYVAMAERRIRQAGMQLPMVFDDAAPAGRE